MRSLVVVAGLLGLALAVFAGVRHYGEDFRSPPDFAQVAFVGSGECLDCHRNRHASWHRTFHRSMTQEATPETVQGRFDGQTLDYQGVRTRPIRQGEGFAFEYASLDSGETLYTAPVVRTVGSRRYQQYLTRDPSVSGNHHRLHWLWHNEEARWVHMNAAFLGPDSQSFDDHVSIWDQNCIFCHNTGPRPQVQNIDELRARSLRGEAVNVAREAEYNSEVAELGISCETCHAPAAEHQRRNRDPLRRWLLNLTGVADPTIVNPARLDSVRSAQICGQCHAQRLPIDSAALDQWIHTGPTYRAGDDLFQHVSLVGPDTRVPGQPDLDLFSLRFWPEGTPRLSAYEYQGLHLSPCHQAAELTCTDCHSMHGGDPEGMLPPDARSNAPCLGCHQAIGEELSAHTRHAPEGEGSLCYNCHMPRIVYGVMAIHRSHRIELPKPQAHAEADRPNACNQCHLEHSPEWAEAWLSGWQEGRPGPAEDNDLAEMLRALHAGDPARRALAVEAAGAYVSQRPAEGNRLLVPHLLLALEDGYPSTRRFAAISLKRLAEALELPAAFVSALDRFDWLYSSADPVNEGLLGALWQSWQSVDKAGWASPSAGLWLNADYLPDMAKINALMASSERRQAQIHIGE